MIQINKICILINWTREIDIYDELLQNLPEDKVDIIINDLNTIEKERLGNSLEIEKNLVLKKKKFIYLKEIFNKKKYKVIISSGFAHSSTITIYSTFKYMFGRTIGHLMDLIGVSSFFMKIFNRPFNAGGKHSRIGTYASYPEKIIGEKSIRYPTGMDLNLKLYPHESLRKNFDIFLTHSLMETNLIKKKFDNKICKNIGYPRYNHLNDKQEILKKLKKEFLLDENKKIIYWTPTHIYHRSETSKNLIPWIDKVAELNDKFNIIIRPHPKLLNYDKSIIKILKEKNFFIDLVSDRKIGDLFTVADLVFCDYGETPFSALFLERPLILLNMDKNFHFTKELNINLSLDLKLRQDLINFDTNIDISDFKKDISNALKLDYIQKTIRIKNLYFGNKKDYISTKDISKFILGLLN